MKRQYMTVLELKVWLADLVSLRKQPDSKEIKFQIEEMQSA